jgi:hypothetical protein
MALRALILALLLPLGAGLTACADEQLRSQRMAEQTAADAQDDEFCRGKGEPGTEFYAECRKAQADARAQKSAIQEQKRRDFDRVLGAGTDGLSDF